MSGEIKFRLVIGRMVVGYEKWYPGAGERAAPQWLYSTDGKHWTPEYIFHRSKDQFTGLKDKNGVEIYEGDILRIKYSDGQYFDASVRWYCGNPHSNDGEYGMETAKWVLTKYAEEKKDCLKEMYHLACEDVREVIGNIHANPELLQPTGG